MVDYNVTGADRKKLVKALERITGERAVYQGMPSTAYRIGEYFVSKTGEVSGAELSDEYKEALSNAGFTPVNESDDPEPVGISITIPREQLSDGTIENLKNMLESKGALIQKAFDLQELPMDYGDDVVSFRWFESKELSAKETEIATEFIAALIEKCRNQRYVNPTPLETDNEKYSFRVFLNSLGFIGSDHKAIRKELLKNLTGSTAWRHGKPQRVIAGDAQN